MATTSAAKKTPCRECDNMTNFTVCSVCGWNVCGRHARKRDTVRGTAAQTLHVCPSCEKDGF